jgi:hypothetical protein
MASHQPRIINPKGLPMESVDKSNHQSATAFSWCIRKP